MRLPLLVLACSLASCSGSRSSGPRAPIQAQLGETVVLEQGDVVQFLDADAVVRFDSISQDTRCPEDTPCASRGEATAHFTLRRATPGGVDAVTPFVLTIEGDLPGDAAENVQRTVSELEEIETVRVKDYHAFLHLLQPYPGFAPERKMPPTAVLYFRQHRD
jgi:hypothetical protein